MSNIVAGAISVRLSRQFVLPAKRLFDAWFGPECFASFLLADAAAAPCRWHFDPRVGGEFVVAARRNDAVLELRGEYLEIERAERLAFELAARDSGARDRVTIELAGLGGGSLLVLLHEMDLAGASDRARFQLGWAAALMRLASLARASAFGKARV